MMPASAVAARWEWREFGHRFPDVEAAMDAARADVRHSTETYIHGAADDVNVKIRADQIDVKRRLRVDAGLEQWSPVLKAPFPVDAAVIAQVFAYWALPVPSLARPSYTAGQFLGEIVAGAPALQIAPVTKARRQVSFDGCVVELASLDVGGTTVGTAAVESEHPEQVHHAARALGLTGHDNVSYVAALRRLVPAAAAHARADAREGASS
jgi:exopolyphosphatase/guanosine-5'-triphosphate,3'-diphosphate pyrophosphatase